MPISKKKKSVFNSKKYSKESKQNIFESIKNKIFSVEEKIVEDKKKQFIYFTLGFILFYLLINTLFGLVPLETYKLAIGKTVEPILALGGVNITQNGFVECSESNWVGMEVKGNCYSFNANDKTILISWLCTGVLEIIVLISAILASFGIGWGKRAKGIIIAVVVGVIFNILRITITVGIVLSQNINMIELAHDLLFRAILFVYIVGVYVLWFNWAMKK